MTDSIEKLTIEHLKQSGWGVKPFYEGNLEQLEAFAKAYAQQSSEPVARCTNEDLWNCKYCQKTLTCDALKDNRNFGVPIAKPKFPVMLRKMWSGGEVQKWIDENFTLPPSTVPLEEHNKRIAELEAENKTLNDAITEDKILVAYANKLEATNKKLLDALKGMVKDVEFDELTEHLSTITNYNKAVQAIADAEGVEK